MASNQVAYNDLQNILQTVPDGKLGDVLKLVDIGGGVLAPRWQAGWKKFLLGTATDQAPGPQSINTTTPTAASGFPKNIPNAEARTVIFTAYATCSRDNTTNNFEFRMFINSSQVQWMEFEAKDAGGSFFGTGTDQKLHMVAKSFPIAVPASNIAVDVQFNGENTAISSLWNLTVVAEEVDSADII